MTELRAVAYVSMGTWVAQCPRPWCVNADHYGPGPNTGRLGGLTLTQFHCLRCGLVCPADWPQAKDDIERLLGQRPMFETRNWVPDETLGDLLYENVMHGVTDPASLPAGGVIIDREGLTAAGRQLVAVGPQPPALQIGA